MPDEKMYTERDLILAKRAAFAVGCCAMGLPFADAAMLAARRYELPKITRPRVVTDSQGAEFRITQGGIVIGRRPSSCDQYMSRWGGFGAWEITPERIALWADLLANPTEEVDDAD